MNGFCDDTPGPALRGFQSAETLHDLARAASALDAEFSETTLGHDQLEFAVSSALVNGDRVPMPQSTRHRLFAAVNAPVSYLDRHSPEFQMSALNEHVRRGDFGMRFKAVLRRGELEGLVRDDLTTLPSGDVLGAVEEGLGGEADSLTVVNIGGDAHRLDLELVTPTKSIEIRRGDVVQAGLHISHERFGRSATVVEAFVLRLVCRNGMTRRECASAGLARTRRLPADWSQARGLQLDQIRRITAHTWDALQPQLAAIRATSEHSTDIRRLLTAWLQDGRMFSVSMLARLMSSWEEEGSDPTTYGAINALTRTATHSKELSPRQRRRLASLAGVLSYADVHICPRCLSVVTGDAPSETGSEGRPQ